MTGAEIISVGVNIGAVAAFFWRAGKVEGHRAQELDDHQARLDVIEDWQREKGASKDDVRQIQEVFQDALASLVRTVDTRLGATETQVRELRQHLLRQVAA